MVTVKIVPNETSNPPGKLADAELHFQPPTHTHADSPAGQLDRRACAECNNPLNGLKLIGFAVWESRAGNRRNVTFPARQYSVNGERRSFALLRPSGTDGMHAQERLRDLILQAYAAYEQNQSAETTTPATDPPIEAPTSYDFGF